MALDGLRKVVTIVEDVEREGGEPVVPATRMVAAGAVVENPVAGSFVDDLEPLIERYCEPLGELLTQRALELLAAPAEGVGKGALVGLDGGDGAAAGRMPWGRTMISSESPHWLLFWIGRVR